LPVQTIHETSPDYVRKILTEKKLPKGKQANKLQLSLDFAP
jgi:hypothetical protein